VASRKTFTAIKEQTFQTCSRQSSTSVFHNDLQSSTMVFHKLERKQDAAKGTMDLFIWKK
jgi:hypothetical protein